MVKIWGRTEMALLNWAREQKEPFTSETVVSNMVFKNGNKVMDTLFCINRHTAYWYMKNSSEFVNVGGRSVDNTDTPNTWLYAGGVC